MVIHFSGLSLSTSGYFKTSTQRRSPYLRVSKCFAASGLWVCWLFANQSHPYERAIRFILQIALHISLKLGVVVFQSGQFHNFMVNVGVNGVQDFIQHILFKIEL
jgi:hypothetical protein